jgi:hypothetical protein
LTFNQETTMRTPPRNERANLKKYADAIGLWNAGFDTMSIATRLKLQESVCARWVANFRDQVRAVTPPLDAAA